MRVHKSAFYEIQTVGHIYYCVCFPRRECIVFSNIFENSDNSEIERWLDTSVRLPVLNMGTTIAIFNSLRKITSLKDWFIRFASKLQSIQYNYIKIIELIADLRSITEFSDVDFFFLSPMIVAIALAVVSSRNIEGPTRFCGTA